MSVLVATRTSLHGLAELVLAGPQHALTGRIVLTVIPEGFGTTLEPGLGVHGTDLVTPAGQRIPLDGRTIADVAHDAGVTPRSLKDVYSDGPGLDEGHVLTVDTAAAAEIIDAFRRGDAALAAFAPEETRALWPEHFDVGISSDEVNYGVSPGDAFLEVPYAYVGPWSRDGLSGAFWNAPFGAARPVSEINDLVSFFAEGQSLAAAR
ncbi:MAG TPA: hypothetical protein VJ782_02980 [Aeromicrobium sp.]|nr:hypothetical protein [Aeromicrobium sp.]